MHLIQKLIQIASESENEQVIHDFICAYFINLGLKPITVKGNVVVHIQGRNHSLAVIFDAHIDTVQVGDESAWKHNPFEGFLDGDVVYGLGASDNKASVASLLLLSQLLIKNPPSCDIWLTFVVNEEIDGSGTENFVDWFKKNHYTNYKKVCAVVMEPTNLKRIEIGHRGNVFVKITTRGKSGHASKPLSHQDNAVLAMAQIALRLHNLNTSWKRKYCDDIFGSPTIGVGTSIVGASTTSINKFSESCEMTADVRTVPSMHAIALSLIEECLAGKAQVSLVQKPAGYGFVSQKSDEVIAIQGAMSSLVVAVSPWSTDQCFFTERSIPAFVIGPGISEVIHQPDEYCLISLIERCPLLFCDFIDRWSGNK